jgi:hypothetical protein
VWKKSRLLGKTTCRKRESPIPVSETSELFVGMHNKALSVAPMRICNPDRSPLGVNGWDPAKLHPALLSLSAMISRDFTRADSAAFALRKTMIFSRCVSQSSHLN